MAAEYPLMLSESDEIILVTDLSLAAARDIIRFLALCKTVAPDITGNNAETSKESFWKKLTGGPARKVK